MSAPTDSPSISEDIKEYKRGQSSCARPAHGLYIEGPVSNINAATSLPGTSLIAAKIFSSLT